MPAESHKEQKNDGIKKRKRKHGTGDVEDREESEIIKLLKVQQETISKAEERDEKLMEVMLKMQANQSNVISSSLYLSLEKLETSFNGKK